MATPHVSGVAALVWSYFPKCSAKQIRQVLNASAMELGRPGKDPEFGFGLVQAKAAYNRLAATGCQNSAASVARCGSGSGSGQSLEPNGRRAGRQDCPARFSPRSPIPRVAPRRFWSFARRSVRHSSRRLQPRRTRPTTPGR